ncbi:MAG TPA: DedA family protein, partial [Thermoanaerobaculia bacterium]
IVRTFAPVVAGMAGMSYRRFALFNVVGGIGWVFSMTMIGYLLVTFFPATERHIEKVIIIVIFVSLLPGIIEYLRNRKKKPAV